MLMISGDDLEITEKLKKARGQKFKALFTAAVHTIGPYLKLEVIHRGGEISILDIGHFCISYNLSFKTCTEILEELGVLPVGTFLMLKAKGLDVKKIMHKVKNL
ncbi:hypothetical protein PN480_03335 [Dolichospermum circinale CS-1225]|uniref:hypothetical protein n=1 Tax=Dolichospermum circinale TaxID=109265 RepID=UPI00232F7127|nr:hypothetical protein [Dolichospermum circinale]MDB9520989.1 hypothetical protein [Dolichospermum circinale CS-1225]